MQLVAVREELGTVSIFITRSKWHDELSGHAHILPLTKRRGEKDGTYGQEVLEQVAEKEVVLHLMMIIAINISTLASFNQQKGEAMVEIVNSREGFPLPFD